MREETMSGHEHLNSDALLNCVYGIEGEAERAHLRECSGCAARLSGYRETKSAGARIEVSDEFLAAQRKEIYQKLERPRRRHLLWAPALAAAGALAIGVLVYHPQVYHPEPQHNQPARAEISDAQLFQEAFAMEHSPAPSAAAPIQSLFEEQE
jgi:hypothetical protein